MKRRAVSAVLAALFALVMVLSLPVMSAAASATVDMGYSPSAPAVASLQRKTGRPLSPA